MNTQYRDPIIADMRKDMKIQHVLKAYPNVHFVDALPQDRQPGTLYDSWLHENMIQVGRAMAHLSLGTFHYDEVLSKQAQGHVITHAYVANMDARLVQRWRYPISYNGRMTEYLGWNVRYIKNTGAGFDLDQLEDHPMVPTMHRVAANNRKYPAKYGASKVMSWTAVPKYAVIAAALKGAEVFIEGPELVGLA